ncbi:MAG: hypothetical protein IKO29_00650 [Bacteroidales bacterium]|nr:hypothetical protein [Bacteroidales bacterium]
MQPLSSYPTIDIELLQKVRIQSSNYQFYYKDDEGEEQELIAEDAGSSIRPLNDDRGRWSPDVDGFGFSRSYTVRCASFLYGASGVACKDATLALALLWKSPDSRQRSACEIGVLPNDGIPHSYNLNMYYPRPCFKGRLDLETVIVVKNAGNPDEEERHLANIPGSVLGVVDTFSVTFDGNGSVFPINIITDKTGLLWSVECDFDDPLFDKFTDCVSINLNNAHPDFKYINPSDKSNYNPSFLREVLAGAVSTIVNYVRESDYWDDIKNGKAEEESVGQALYYFASSLNLNLDDAKQCSYAFRDYFTQKLGEL